MMPDTQERERPSPRGKASNTPQRNEIISQERSRTNDTLDSILDRTLPEQAAQIRAMLTRSRQDSLPLSDAKFRRIYQVIKSNIRRIVHNYYNGLAPMLDDYTSYTAIARKGNMPETEQERWRRTYFSKFQHFRPRVFLLANCARMFDLVLEVIYGSFSREIPENAAPGPEEVQWARKQAESESYFFP